MRKLPHPQEIQLLNSENQPERWVRRGLSHKKSVFTDAQKEALEAQLKRQKRVNGA